MRVLVFGDSIAQGFWDIEGGWVDRLKRHYDSIALKNIRIREFTTVFNLGVSGDTSSNLLARLESETKARKWPGEGQIVILAIGTNDDFFEKSEPELESNIQKAVEVLEPLVEKTIIIGNPACDEIRTMPVFWADVYYSNEAMETNERILQQAANKNNIPFVPLFNTFKRKLKDGENLLEDGLHPNSQGHKLIFELVRPELDKLLNT